MRRPASRASCWALVLLLAWLGVPARSRVVQLVAEGSSSFVSADPDDPKFIVSLFDEAAQATTLLPEPPALRSIVMADASGQRFNCSIPTSPSGAGTALAAQQPDFSEHFSVAKSPFELLEALTALCLYHKDGLWTYEVCHRKHVRQFRQVSGAGGSGIAVAVDASDGRMQRLLATALQGDLDSLLAEVLALDDNSGRKAEDFSCGQYKGDEAQTEDILEDTSSSGHALKYVRHNYGGGAKCVLTGQPRTAEVRYMCSRGAKDNTVVSVREFPTCNYVVVVSTPFLCKHPSFTPPEEDLRLVSCVPLEGGTAEAGLQQQPMQRQQQQQQEGAAPADGATPSLPPSQDGASANAAEAGLLPDAAEQQQQQQEEGGQEGDEPPHRDEL